MNMIPKILLVLLVILLIFTAIAVVSRMDTERTAEWQHAEPALKIQDIKELADEANKRSEGNLKELIEIHNMVMDMEEELRAIRRLERSIHDHIMGIEEEIEEINRIISQQGSR